MCMDFNGKQKFRHAFCVTVWRLYCSVPPGITPLKPLKSAVHESHAHTLHEDNFPFSWLGGLPATPPPHSQSHGHSGVLAVVGVEQSSWRGGPKSTIVSLPPHAHPTARRGGLR